LVKELSAVYINSDNLQNADLASKEAMDLKMAQISELVGAEKIKLNCKSLSAIKPWLPCLEPALTTAENRSLNRRALLAIILGPSLVVLAIVAIVLIKFYRIRSARISKAQSDEVKLPSNVSDER
jgi:hypothetical protein